MSESPIFSLRPHVRSSGNATLEGAFRIHLAPKDIKILGLEAGDLCSLKTSDSNSAQGFIWPLYESNNASPKRIAKISDTLKDAYNLNYQDRVTIIKDESGLLRADAVYIGEINTDLAESEKVESDEVKFWASHSLCRFDAMIAGGTFDITFRRSLAVSKRRRYMIERIEPQNTADDSQGQLYYFDYNSKIVISNDSTQLRQTEKERNFKINAECIGGLQKQLDWLNKRLKVFNSNNKRLRLPSHMRRNGAILLYGLEGTGKSLLVQKLAQLPWSSVISIDESVLGQYMGQSQASLRKLFARAIANQPSLVIIDKVESLAGKRDIEQQNGSSLASALAAEFDKVREHQVLVVAATNKPNDIDKSLRTPGRFRYEVELPVPDVNARIEILKVHLNKDKTCVDQVCDIIGEKTHGYVGSDLGALCETAIERAIDRYTEVETTDSVPTSESTDINLINHQDEDNADKEEDVLRLHLEDFNAALLEIRPTAMREVFFEAPKVKWSDIGGSENIRKAFSKVVERPFKNPQLMIDLDLEPQKGILLYGPPGCSKTLTAKAVAHEAQLNFIAVKGAELTSMYVGESERAIREVFRKARAAAPSIIFFDEIDAIASSRSSPSNSSFPTSSSSSGLNVLTTLLNEMDGIEHLRGVLVLAATNKPGVLDPALMRPGRFDSLIYIGLPDGDARRQILGIRTRKMPLAADVDLELLAQRTDGYTGAEIVRICVEAAEVTADEREAGDWEAIVGMRCFDVALQRVVRNTTPGLVEWFKGFSRGEWRGGSLG